ncbi:MAG: RDD family protein [Ectobacillus sp.]
MKLKIHQPTIIINRIGAAVIDMFIISFIYGMIVALVTGRYRAMFNRFDVSLGDYRYDFALIFTLMALYFIVLPLFWKGQTVGKRFTRIRILKANGEQVELKTLVWRFILLIVPNAVLLGIPLIVNVYIMLFRQDNRGYHDLAAKTKVINAVV